LPPILHPSCKGRAELCPSFRIIRRDIVLIQDFAPPSVRTFEKEATRSGFACSIHLSADGGYAGDETARAAYEASRIRLAIVKRTDREVKGFIVLPKRWIVERTFGWVNRARRLAMDFEALISSSQAWFMLSMTFLLVRRIARDYETAA
jgi:transposase